MSRLQSSFEPCKPQLALALFALCYGLGGGVLIFVSLRELSAEAGGIFVIAEQAALVALYLAGAYLLLLYVVLAPYRFRFDATSFSVFTWRGWRTFAWSQVERADLSTFEGTVELVLFLGPVRRVSVPIASFLQPASLFEAIRSRLRVPIAASERQQALLQDRQDGSRHACH
jgi:hypothetical protein